MQIWPDLTPDERERRRALFVYAVVLSFCAVCLLGLIVESASRGAEIAVRAGAVTYYLARQP